MIFILGILDLMAALIFALKFILNNNFPDSLVISAAFYLIAKGAIFLMGADFASILDILSGGILILSIFVKIPLFIFLIVVIFLVQKGMFSFVSESSG